MCELLPRDRATIRFSLDAFLRRGGLTAPHKEWRPSTTVAICGWSGMRLLQA